MVTQRHFVWRQRDTACVTCQYVEAALSLSVRVQCLVEAVCILDCVCVEDASLVYRAFPCVKALYGRLHNDTSFARVLLPIAQFYLNHGVCVYFVVVKSENKFAAVILPGARKQSAHFSKNDHLEYRPCKLFT